jgi:3-dehydroquinate synthetase
MRYGIITDDIIAPLFGKQVAAAYNATLFMFPHGEKNKTRGTKEKLEDEMLEKGFDKNSCLIGLGGGVVIDITGFIAATFARGIPLILIPTTLLAMVDAAIGGKNGVNTRFGKNLIGTIYQPQEVVIDISYLKTLPETEIRQGVAEMVKHGFLNASYLKTLELEGITENTIRQSGDIKREWIAKDRDALNFGHTIGHAIESASNYTIPHGDAISMGMAAESYIAQELGQSDQFSHVVETLKKFKLPTQIPSFNNLLTYMKRDKKNSDGRIRFSLIEGPVDESLIMKSLCLQL